MRVLHFLIFIFLLTGVNSVSAKTDLSYGSWQGKLLLNDSTFLPFRMMLSKTKTGIPNIQIQNAKEKINLIYKESIQDTLIFDFPQFDSRLYIRFTSSSKLEGYWLNKNKKGRYTVSLSGHKCSNDLFECQKRFGNTINLDQKWKTTFAPNTDDAWPAVGLFTRSGEDLTGTFLTETGDYRFLDGNMYGDQLYLSCFDGSHAFLFTAVLENNVLNGMFYSGNHYSCDWSAVSDSSYQLANANSLTRVVSENPLNFSFKNLDGSIFTYPNSSFKNKVTIIQIMGTWCPNCMDETRYLMDVYKQYHDKGLEIISVGYEVGSVESEYEEKLKRFQQRNQIPFTMLIGGTASKSKASKDFPMLSDILSFPTSIIINKSGEIVKIHTGFSGPGTGEYYQQHVKETNALLQELLNQ